MTRAVDFNRSRLVALGFNKWVRKLADEQPDIFSSRRFTYSDLDGLWRQYGHTKPEWLSLIEVKEHAARNVSLINYAQARALRELGQLCALGAGTGKGIVIDHTGKRESVEFRGAWLIRLAADSVEKSEWFEINRVGSRPQPLIPDEPRFPDGDSDFYRLDSADALAEWLRSCTLDELERLAVERRPVGAVFFEAATKKKPRNRWPTSAERKAYRDWLKTPDGLAFRGKHGL